MPTMIMSCEDDLFGTAATASLLAARIPAAELILYPTGGYIWLGQDEDEAEQIAGFIRGTATVPREKQ